MKDYFDELIRKLDDKKYNITWQNISRNYKGENNTLVGYLLSDEVSYIYNNYDLFQLNWEGDGYKGFIHFVSYEQIEKEHIELIEIMREIYDYKRDFLKIKEDIEHWYPLFEFPNGDSFCLDVRNGNVVFYEHEVYDTGINLHGLIIALSVNDLFEKWSKCLFVDIYDWYEGVDEEGIDMKLDIYSDLL